MTRTRHKTLLVFTIAALLLTAFGTPPYQSTAQSFDEIVRSDAYNQVLKDSASSKNSNSHSPKKGGRPLTNYDLLWNSQKPGYLLLDWIGTKSTGLRTDQFTSQDRDEYVRASATFRDRERVTVELTIQVPRPEFITMAEYGTLIDFNKLRPPLLDVVADQVVPIQGLDANYYRHKDGACSLLFSIDKQSLVNLYTKRCSDSSVMMQVAKALSFSRLIQKLNS